ncbi:MAG TPA: xanthine dehydrogenase family protein molybdopterin-binding subunit [Polyangia bacterium]|jgi:xanthine dehydrogenase YagR molybdenum-binding subunit|nr:xanthine dehydrogenase family protein molybdopterin-binding subunit [Polyangia bacterium]
MSERDDRYVGRGLDRVDARAKVTGQARYSAEIPMSGDLAHAVIVGSPVGLGHLDALDTGAAERAPGVLAVITPANAPRLPGAGNGGGDKGRVLQLLQDSEIRYNDQPIALVVARTLEDARRGAELVSPRISAREPIIEAERERERAYKPDKTARGPADWEHGDFARGFGEAAVRIDATYRTPVENHNPMELHATTAVWEANGHLTLYDSSQGIFGVRKKIADVFGISPDQIRVICHHVGGGFGCKGSAWSHVPLAALAARVARRPVKLMVTRQQMFSLVGHRPSTLQRVALGADRTGQLLAIRHDVLSETSRFDEFIEPAAAQTRMLYACPNVTTSQRVVRLDVPTPTFTRAPGESTGTYALESAMDELSYALHLDPIQLRLRNHADRDPQSGKPWSSKSLRACYERGAEAFGWARRKPRPRSMRDGHWLLGWGMASATYPANQSPASAVARIRADGTALVQSGTQDLGTGTYTVMSQIAADALGLPFEKVRFELGDTSLPEAPLSAGSRTAASVGPAVHQAARAAVGKLVALAVGDARSPLARLSTDQIEAADGALRSKVEPGRRDAYSDILKRAGLAEVAARADARAHEEREKFSVHSFGAQFAEVKVDEDLGEVRVTRFVGAYGAGTILNAKTARSQFHGGIIWGLGMALMERTARDVRNGRAVTRDLADYHVPVHADIPAIQVILVDETDHAVNDVGAKGIGELGMTGAAAAIANAVYHATGKRVRDLPITPDKLL